MNRRSFFKSMILATVGLAVGFFNPLQTPAAVPPGRRKPDPKDPDNQRAFGPDHPMPQYGAIYKDPWRNWNNPNPVEGLSEQINWNVETGEGMKCIKHEVMQVRDGLEAVRVGTTTDRYYRDSFTDPWKLKTSETHYWDNYIQPAAIALEPIVEEVQQAPSDMIIGDVGIINRWNFIS